MLIRSLIEQGAGTRVKPHLIIDYLNHLKGRAHQSSPKPLRRGLSKGPTGDGAAAAGGPANAIPHHNTFEALLDILEFRNHQLRWQLILEALLPVNTGQPGLKIKTTDHERVLAPEYVQHLWKEGNPKKAKTFQSFTHTTDQHKYGRRTVGKITDGRYTLYVKQYPELPGIEEAVGMMTRQVLGYGAPNTLLANIEGSAYLFSEGIPGKPLHDYLSNHTDIPWPVVQEKLEPEALSGMILLAMLTNPEDGKPDNYIVQETPLGTYRLVGIDNDHAFVPAYSKPSRDWLGRQTLKMNVKTILFALDQMNKPLHPNLKRQFLFVRPGDIIREWVAKLTDQAVRYNELFSEAEILNHFTTQNTFLGIALHPSIVVDLYKNLSSLQSLIQSTEDLTHMDILRNFQRTIYLRYQEGFTEHPTANPLDRFKHVDGREYKLHTKGSLQTLSTGKNLLSTNMMITTQKDLLDYVKRARGQEIGLDQVLQDLAEIEARDTTQLAQQAMAAEGANIPLDHMTEAQRDDFFKKLDWSKLPIKNQQALIQQMAIESQGDARTNKSPWRGKLIFKNCAGFTQGGVFTRGNVKGIHWHSIRRMDVEINQTGGQAAIESLKVMASQLPDGVKLNLTLRGLDITDDDLDQIIEGKEHNINKLYLEGCKQIKDPALRQAVPGLRWVEWKRIRKNVQTKLRGIVLGTVKDKKLDLERQNIDDARAKALAAVLKDSAVQYLDLGGNMIGAVGAKALAAVLKGSAVQYLDLWDNKIGDVGAKALAARLKGSKIQHLYLQHNSIGDAGIKALAAGLKGSAVQDLELLDRNIGAEGTKALAAVLKESSVQYLALWGNEIGAAAAKALAAGLKESSVQRLHLGNRNIGAVGAKALAAVLKESSVQRLYLEKNKISDEGAKALAAGLKGSSVQHLGLRYNNIGAAGAKALAAGLKEGAVQHLNLGGNNIGAEGAKALAAGLKGSSVQHLDLRQNNIGDSLQDQLKGIISQNKNRLKGTKWELKEKTENDATSLIVSPETNGAAAEPSHLTSDASSLVSQAGHSVDDLEDLLAKAGLTGAGEVPTFASPLAQAQHYMTQNDRTLYPTILNLLEQTLNAGRDQEVLHLQGFEAAGQESSTDFEERVGDEDIPSQALDLLKDLSDVYPKALISLAKACDTLGNISAAYQTFQKAMKEQLPQALDLVKEVFERDSHPVYAELMAENYLEGYMNPVDLKQGERWLRLALERDPTNSDLQIKLAQVLIDQGGLEDKEIYPEIMTILEEAKEASIDAQALLLRIEEKQANRAVRDHGLSGQEQRHIARQQRLLRVLHQAQFVTDDRQRIDLTPEQKEALQILKVQQSEEQDVLAGEIAATEEELAEAGPMDRRSVEEGLESLKQRLRGMQQKHRAALKGLLFPEGVSQAPQIKQFYETVKEAIRQQISLIDAIEGGLAERKQKFLETQLTEAVGQAVGYAVGQAVGYVGGMLVSNMPVPGNGILAMIVEKAFEKGIEKITEIAQTHAVGKHYERRAERERGQASQAMGGFDQAAFVAKGLASIYTYRLQNIIPHLTEKSAKELSSRLGLSVVQYLQDQKRRTNPETLTQLATLSFYHRKGATIGDRLQKARGVHGLKLNDGKTFLSYREIFKAPQLETTDGAQYQMGEEASARIQIVPLIERVILQSPELQGKQVNLKEVRMPQLSPLQVSLIEEQDDADYIRRAVEFVQDMAV